MPSLANCRVQTLRFFARKNRKTVFQFDAVMYNRRDFCSLIVYQGVAPSQLGQKLSFSLPVAGIRSAGDFES